MTKTGKVSRIYLDLIHKFPLRPIRSRPDLKAASELFSELGLKGRNRSRDEDDYLAVLGQLIRDYERKHVMTSPLMTPRRALESLMEDNGLTQLQLARETGTRQSHISEFLSGKRGMSKANAVRLAERFKVSTDLFLRA